MDEFGVGIATDRGFEETVLRTRIAMRAQGFSILSEMPAPAEVGGEMGRKHVFMGVWSRIVSTDNLGGQGLDVGDHLAASLVVYEQAGTTYVAALDPAEGLEGWSKPGIMSEAGAALRQLLEEIAGSQSSL